MSASIWSLCCTSGLILQKSYLVGPAWLPTLVLGLSSWVNVENMIPLSPRCFAALYFPQLTHLNSHLHGFSLFYSMPVHLKSSLPWTVILIWKAKKKKKLGQAPSTKLTSFSQSLQETILEDGFFLWSLTIKCHKSFKSLQLNYLILPIWPCTCCFFLIFLGKERPYKFLE